MKKTIFTLTFIWIALTVEAQIHTIGIQSGLNISNITQPRFSGLDHKIGLITGLKYEILLSDNNVLAVDMLYTQQGFIQREFITHSNGIETEGITNHEINFLSLPIKFGHSFGDKVKFIPKIGIQPSLLLNAKMTGDMYENDGTFIGTEVDNYYHRSTKFDFAGILELELEYSILHNIDVFASISSVYRFTRLNIGGFYSGEKLKHTSIPISIGLKYALTQPSNLPKERKRKK